MAKLTMKAVLAMEPGKREYIKFDDTIPGFGVRVYPSGKKAWTFRYKHHRVPRQMTIGAVEGIHIDTAKDMARDLYTQVRQGKDPVAEARRKDRTMTVAELFEEYIGWMERQGDDAFSSRTRMQYRTTLNCHIKPRIGRVPIGAPELYVQVARMHTDMATTPTAANRTLINLDVVYAYARKNGYVDRTFVPTLDIKHYPERNRSDAMSVAEAAACWHAAGEWAEQERIAGNKWWVLGYGFQLLMAFGARKSEVLRWMFWENVTDEKITIPVRGNKTRNKEASEIVFFQTDLTRSILSKLPRRDRLVFGVNGKHAVSNADYRSWCEIEQLAGLTRHYRIHDIRHSMADIADTETTLEDKHISALLNHASMQTTERVYLKRKKNLRARKRATEAMSKLLEKTFNPEQQ